MSSRILRVKELRLSPWVTLLEKTVDDGNSQSPQTFHAFRVADYSNVLAITSEKKAILVRQFRPGINCYTLELPGGLVEGKEDARDRVVIEFREETGLFLSPESLVELGTLAPCPARLENRIFGYFAADVSPDPVSDYVPEPGIEVLHLDIEELRQAVLESKILNAQHVAMIGLAVMKGLLK